MFRTRDGSPRFSRANVDTDQIIPKQFLKPIERTGFGACLFYDWRHQSDGTLNPEFELNRGEAQGATVLLTGANFGCGSSREHAPWALAGYGFRAIIASSFADIFYANCCQNGLLPVILPEVMVDELFRLCGATERYELTIDLERLSLLTTTASMPAFTMNEYGREMLLRGLDEIGRTLLDEERIALLEQRRRLEPGVMKTFTIAVLPGDGIGPEVTAEAVRGSGGDSRPLPLSDSNRCPRHPGGAGPTRQRDVGGQGQCARGLAALARHRDPRRR